MGVLDLFKFQRSPTYEDIELDTTKEISKNLALKSSALDKVANYVGRGISKASFKLKGDKRDEYRDWEYLLTAKPNPNQHASEFFSEIGKTLIKSGEVLIVVLNNHLFIAGSYSKEKHDLKGDSYRVMTIQGINIDKVFKNDKYILIQNENEDLKSFIDTLWADYGELLGRLINRQKTANQIRFTMGMPKDRLREKAQELADGGAQRKSPQQRFFDRVVQKIKNDSVVAIPVNADSSYSEYSNRYSSKASFVDDIKNVKNQYVDELCEIIGIPSALIHGENADNQKNHEQIIETVFEPMVKKIVDGLNAGMFEPEDFLNGNRVKAIGLHHKDLFDVATSGDKLIASGIAMADEIREEIGLDPLPNGAGQKIYITKNYEEYTKKGEVDENSSN